MRLRVEVFKRLGTENWENRYYIETLSFTTAQEVAPDIVAAERLFHSEQVNFYQVRISTQAEDDGQFVTMPFNVNGSLGAVTTGSLLPLWNVLKVYFQKDLARPDYKLYRGCIGEANSESGVIGTNMQNTVFDALETLVLGDPVTIWPKTGVAYAGLVVDSLIRQRDVHRRRRKASTPPLVTA